MLLFIEAVAWFLLKQYRALLDEYKYYYRFAQRRADFLIAYMTSPGQLTKEVELLLITTLLQEPAPLVLRQGESTESLEARKVDSANPVLDFAVQVLDRLPGSKKNANVADEDKGIARTG